MNWDSCEEPKNSLMAATMGRMFTRLCGVISSPCRIPCVSGTTRSAWDRADTELVLIACPPCGCGGCRRSMSSVCTPASLACSALIRIPHRAHDVVASAEVFVVGGRSPLLLIQKYDLRQVVGAAVEKNRPSSSGWAESMVGGLPGGSACTFRISDSSVVAGRVVDGSNYLSLPRSSMILARSRPGRGRASSSVAGCLRWRSIRTDRMSRLVGFSELKPRAAAGDETFALDQQRLSDRFSSRSEAKYTPGSRTSWERRRRLPCR